MNSELVFNCVTVLLLLIVVFITFQNGGPEHAASGIPTPQFRHILTIFCGGGVVDFKLYSKKNPIDQYSVIASWTRIGC